MLSVNEACERLKLSRWTIYKLIRDGELTAIKGPGGANAHVRITDESYAAYIERRAVKAAS